MFVIPMGYWLSAFCRAYSGSVVRPLTDKWDITLSGQSPPRPAHEVVDDQNRGNQREALPLGECGSQFPWKMMRHPGYLAFGGRGFFIGGDTFDDEPIGFFGFMVMIIASTSSRR